MTCFFRLGQGSTGSAYIRFSLAELTIPIEPQAVENPTDLMTIDLPIKSNNDKKLLSAICVSMTS